MGAMQAGHKRQTRLQAGRRARKRYRTGAGAVRLHISLKAFSFSALLNYACFTHGSLAKDIKFPFNCHSEAELGVKCHLMES